MRETECSCVSCEDLFNEKFFGGNLLFVRYQRTHPPHTLEAHLVCGLKLQLCVVYAVCISIRNKRNPLHSILQSIKIHKDIKTKFGVFDSTRWLAGQIRWRPAVYCLTWSRRRILCASYWNLNYFSNADAEMYNHCHVFASAAAKCIECVKCNPSRLIISLPFFTFCHSPESWMDHNEFLLLLIQVEMIVLFIFPIKLIALLMFARY